jgi:selenium metabolism protein YedF
MTTIDTRGELCPKPLIMTKKALDTIKDGEEFEVLTDNDTSHQNLMNYLEALKADPLSEKTDNIWHITATKPININNELTAEEFCSTPLRTNDYVVVVSSQCMGQGDDELGKLLIRGFINSLNEQEKLPTHIILYNSGVMLASNDTDTVQSLVLLQKKGVSVVVCGTCVDFFGIKDKLGAGMISNMYHITTILTSTTKIIYP